MDHDSDDGTQPVFCLQSASEAHCKEKNSDSKQSILARSSQNRLHYLCACMLVAIYMEDEHMSAGTRECSVMVLASLLWQ